MNKDRLLIVRADAGTQMGTGHVMRCLALAQAWQIVGGRVVFVMATEARFLDTRLTAEGMEVVHLPVQPGSTDDAVQTAHLARKSGAAWVAVDGYHFGADYQKIIKNHGLRLLFIDDYGHSSHYPADIVLNQNLHAHEHLYVNRELDSRLLLGSRYVLLRREFLKWQGWKRVIPNVARKVLVTLGGSDPNNVTSKVIQAIQQIEIYDLELVIVIGGSNPHRKRLQAAVQDSKKPIRLESNVVDMPALMAWSDVAISAGGSTCWEMAFMGLPNIVLVLADNQELNAKELDSLGVATNLGWHEGLSTRAITEVLTDLIDSSDRMLRMSLSGHKLVDGEGCSRVLMHLLDNRLRLRPVQLHDCQLLWNWANDQDVRAMSFSSQYIPWAEHFEWFNLKLKDPNCMFLIAINSDEMPVGQVRFDVEGNESVISVSIDRKYRFKGYGTELIRLASQELLNTSTITKINAYFKPNNPMSVRAFEKAGYRSYRITEVRGFQAIHLTCEKGNLG